MEYRHGKVEIRMWPDFSKAHIRQVIANVRPEDREELAEYGFKADELINRLFEIVGSTPVSYMVFRKGEPVFMFGLTFQHRHAAMLWGFGTRDTPKVIPAVTRYVQRQWLQDVHTGGVRRIEARVPTTSTGSIRWLNSCGMRPECRLDGLTTGETPVIQLSYTWSANNGSYNGNGDRGVGLAQ